MDPFSLELHDARLIDINLDPVHGHATLMIDAYEESSSSTRIKLQVRFEHVQGVSMSFDAGALASNFKAGNISYWHPGVLPLATHLYLSDGYIAISAAAIAVTKINI
jgi:hypothetical protein